MTLASDLLAWYTTPPDWVNPSAPSEFEWLRHLAAGVAFATRDHIINTDPSRYADSVDADALPPEVDADTRIAIYAHQVMWRSRLGEQVPDMPGVAARLNALFATSENPTAHAELCIGLALLGEVPPAAVMGSLAAWSRAHLPITWRNYHPHLAIAIAQVTGAGS